MSPRLYQRGKRRTWWIEFRDPVTGKEVRRSLRVRNKRDAEGLAREYAEQVARRHHRFSERKLWTEAVAAYLAYSALHKARVTTEDETRTLRRRFTPPEVVRYVHEVREEHIESYLASRKALGLSPFSVNRELRILRAFFNWCARDPRRWLSDSPARHIRLLPEPRGAAARRLTSEELSRLMQLVAGTRLEGIVLVASNHGLRESELIHLQQGAVNLSAGTLWVRHDPDPQWLVKGGWERVVYLNQVTRTWLQGHLSRGLEDSSAYVFTTEAGLPWCRQALVKVVGRVMRRVGIRRGGLHMLRHTWATLQTEAGTPMPVLKELGGWRTWRSMEKYQHVADDAKRQAAARVMIAPGPVAPPPKVVSLKARRGDR